MSTFSESVHRKLKIAHVQSYIERLESLYNMLQSDQRRSIHEAIVDKVYTIIMEYQRDRIVSSDDRRPRISESDCTPYQSGVRTVCQYTLGILIGQLKHLLLQLMHDDQFNRITTHISRLEARLGAHINAP